KSFWELELGNLRKAWDRVAKRYSLVAEPFVIVKFLTKVTVQLANPDTRVLVRKAHVSQLKSYWVGEQAI
ncbi:hypothetical protein B7P43_G14055, partial [Cryptotermes secundus]